MVRFVKLKGRIHLDNGRHVFTSKMHDGTEFSVHAGVNDIQINDGITAERPFSDGWLLVTQEAQQDTRCYLTLPAPSLSHGRQVLVHELQLMPVAATLADFGPQKPSKTKAATKASKK